MLKTMVPWTTAECKNLHKKSGHFLNICSQGHVHKEYCIKMDGWSLPFIHYINFLWTKNSVHKYRRVFKYEIQMIGIGFSK